MHPGSDPMGQPASFTARRSAASNLPSFELPPPPLASHKFPGFAASSLSQPPMSHGAGNLLTPPNTLPGDGSNPLSPTQSNASGSAHNNLQSYGQGSNNNNNHTHNNYWSQSSQSAQYGPYSGPSPQQWIPPRGLVFPQHTSLNGMVRDSNGHQSMSASQQQTHDAYQLPPFASSMSMSASNNSLPAMTGHSQHAMATTQTSPVNGQDTYHLRQPPTPSYYNNSSSSQSGFPQYSAGPSPTQASPMSAGPQSRLSPVNGSHDMSHVQGLNQASPQQYQRPFGQYPLPAMNGPVMSNLHSPTGQMSVVGGMPGNMMSNFSSGHAASMHHMYGVPHGGAQAQLPNDRPFKCDQCMQSFNRNHDLKRHKRIHLAVKPFPCDYCDKAFSRKDALKRHILVKGCGKGHMGDDADKQSSSSSTSPVSAKAERSPLTDGQPHLNGGIRHQR